MLITYCLALPSIRFVLKSKSPNDKQLALTKPPSTLKQAIKACFGRFRKVVDSLDEASCTVGAVAVTGLFPTDETAALSKGNRFYIFVNDRPAGLKELRKRTKAMWQPLIGDRFPWMVLKITSKACSWGSLEDAYSTVRVAVSKRRSACGVSRVHTCLRPRVLFWGELTVPQFSRQPRPTVMM